VDFSGTLIRLHIGLENVDDLIADLAAGFARIVNCLQMDNMQTLLVEKSALLRPGSRHPGQFRSTIPSKRCSTGKSMV
jgi:cystathionine beta-lyase